MAGALFLALIYKIEVGSKFDKKENDLSIIQTS